MQAGQLSRKLAEKLTEMLAGFLEEKLVQQLIQKPLGCAAVAVEVWAWSHAQVLAHAVCTLDCARSCICTV